MSRTDTTAPIQPWEQQPGESAQAYRGFRQYLEMSPTERSVRDAYRQVYGKPTATQAAGFFSAWAIGNRWRARAQEWDAAQARIEHEARMKEAAANAAKWARRREQIAEEDFNDAQRLRERVRDIMALPLTAQTLTDTQESPDGRTVIHNYHIEPLKVRAADAAQMLRLASERQRLAAEMATEIVETVTPEGQAAARLAEARKAYEDGLAQFGPAMAERLAQDLAAAYSQPHRDILIQPEDLYSPGDVTVVDGIQ
jgi:hypothetical protein